MAQNPQIANPINQANGPVPPQGNVPVAGVPAAQGNPYIPQPGPPQMNARNPYVPQPGPPRGNPYVPQAAPPQGNVPVPPQNPNPPPAVNFVMHHPAAGQPPIPAPQIQPGQALRQRAYGDYPRKPHERRNETQQQRIARRDNIAQGIAQRYQLNPQQFPLAIQLANGRLNTYQNPIPSDRTAGFGQYQHLIQQMDGNITNILNRIPFNSWIEAVEKADLEYDPKLLDRRYASTYAARNGLVIYEGDRNNDGLPDIMLCDANGFVKAYNGYKIKPSKQRQYMIYYQYVDPVFDQNGKFDGYEESFEEFNNQVARGIPDAQRKALNRDLKAAGLATYKVINKPASTLILELIGVVYDQIMRNNPNMKKRNPKIMFKKEVSNALYAELIGEQDRNNVGAETQAGKLLRKILKTKKPNTAYHRFAHDFHRWFHGVIPQIFNAIMQHQQQHFNDQQNLVTYDTFNENFYTLFRNLVRQAGIGPFTQGIVGLMRAKQQELANRPAYVPRLQGAQPFVPHHQQGQPVNHQVNALI